MIEQPECQYGYTGTQIERLLGEETQAFWGWMQGQTMMLCQQDPQREWQGDDLVEVGPPLCDRPHGGVVYPWDFANYLRGGPILD